MKRNAGAIATRTGRRTWNVFIERGKARVVGKSGVAD